MKARKRFSRVVASTLTLALLLGMLPMAAFAADPDYAPTVAELKNMTMENVLNAEEISLYSNGEMTNYFYRGINLSNNALVKVGYTLEQSQPVSLALYKMAEGDEWTGDEVELVPGDTTDPEPFLADFVGYLYGPRVLDNIDNPDEEAEEVTGHQLSREDWMYIISETATGMRPQKAIIGDYAYGFAGKKLPLEKYKGGPTPENISPLPTETPVASPEVTDTPTPVETETPLPEESGNLPPTETESPVPEESELPAPDESATPVPGGPEELLPFESENPIPSENEPTSESTGTPEQLSNALSSHVPVGMAGDLPELQGSVATQEPMMPEQEGAMKESTPPVETEAPTLPETTEPLPNESAVPTPEESVSPAPEESVVPLPEESAPSIEPAPSESVPLPESSPSSELADDPRPELTYDDVIFNRGSIFASNGDLEDAAKSIINYILWDGRVVESEGAEPFLPEYEDGARYVIVL